mmetsp:Transcript_36658/g.80343  ORF Transcript_36658/g.80343 Transcript_36658/m.80343 type:complete len:464 (-) Transcript_36658:325-1716(-)|eukprot:CAMPEP_0170593908 /NCGR_PEP_ID=MMETSP0224-20130122/13712_1 /TAXON_ID=285029 /ORGANISM="Togula jolla, Strain CCCM 725" /LENGTH=463 /DNA_ID=CAMNT_0010917919 /DNA_START=29 /DNA_END=1420 /DNA_ORIENTATION=-
MASTRELRRQGTPDPKALTEADLGTPEKTTRWTSKLHSVPGGVEQPPGKALAFENRADATASAVERLIKGKSRPLAPARTVLPEPVAQIASEETPQEDKEHDALRRLFVSLDSALQVSLLRGRRPTLRSIRPDVQATSSKSLTDDRIGRILALSGNMLSAKWTDPGGSSKAELELAPLGPEGCRRAPTSSELLTRKAAFEDSLKKAAEQGSLPASILPVLAERRVAEAPVASRSVPTPASNTPMSAAQAGRQGPSLSASSEVDTPWERLRKRVRAKEAAANSPAARARAELERRIRVCDDALAVHAIVVQLFAQAPVKQATAFSERRFNASTTEGKVLAAVSSQSYGLQSIRTLKPDAAAVALAHLIERASGWFIVEDSQLETKARYLIRQPDGRSSAAETALLEEKRKLRGELSSLEASVAMAGTSEPETVSVQAGSPKRKATTPRKAEGRKRMRTKGTTTA